MKTMNFTEDQVVMYCEMTYPLGRTGYLSDIPKAVEFLASDNSSFITGINMAVDGGALIAKNC